MTAMLVPSPATVLRDKLPCHAVLYDDALLYKEAGEILTSGSLLDIRGALQEASKTEQVYYKTDHHWTLAGAEVGYRAYCETVGRKAYDRESFDVREISDSFYGTLYSKALDCDAQPDVMSAAQSLPAVAVQCDGREQKGIYDTRKLGEKDKYAYFFGGNYGEVIIRSREEGTEKQPKLLVIKDSFANSMIPFLLQDYSEIRMLDMRYFKASVAGYLKKFQPAEILVLYEMSNFAQDKNLNKLMK